jgi:hypothetical protein
MAAIDTFVATLNKGTARTNRFEAEIVPPAAIAGAGANGQLIRDLNLRIESVAFPGKNIRTTTDENIYGPTYEVAQGLTYAEEISMTFYLNNNHEERWFFNSWQDYIVSPTTYDVSYYNEYVSTMRVYQLDQNDRRTAGIEIRDVFPKTINEIEFSHGSTNELVKGTVGLAFREWAPLEIDPVSGVARVYDEYQPFTAGSGPRAPANFSILRFNDSFPRSRPISNAFVDLVPPRAKGIFEDAGKAFNQVLDARNQVVQAQQKVVAFKNFFKGITRSSNPLGNLGIGGFGGF